MSVSNVNVIILIGLQLVAYRLHRRVGIAGGGLGVEPPVHVCRRSFLSENWFKISIPVQNFKHFDIWPPVVLGQFQHCYTVFRKKGTFYFGHNFCEWACSLDLFSKFLHWQTPKEILYATIWSPPPQLNYVATYTTLSNLKIQKCSASEMIVNHMNIGLAS